MSSLLSKSLVAAAVVTAACAHVPTLVPEAATETPSLARAVSNGVTVEVLANAWRGDPSSLPEQLTPLWLHLRNDGETAYDLTYAALQLVDEQGRLYAAVPPMEALRMLVGSVPAPQPVEVAELESDVEVAQFGFGMGMGPTDPSWGSPSYETANAASAVLGRALREGRLLPHTQAAGFVYFQRANAAHQLTLRIQAPSESGTAPLTAEMKFTVEP